MEETLNNLAFLQHVPCTFKLDPVSSLCQTIRIENSIDVFFKKNIHQVKHDSTYWYLLSQSISVFLFCQECFHLTVQQIVEFAKLPTVPYGSLQTKAPMMVWRWWTPTETNTTSWGHFTWGTFNGIQLSNLNSNYGWKPMAISKEFSKPVWTSKKIT